MATTGTLFSLEGKPFPFIGIGVAAAQVITPIPSAEIVFQVVSGVITVAAGGLDQSIFINCNLPRTFCYVLVEVFFRIESADAGDWDAATVTTIEDSSSQATVLIPLRLTNDSIGHTSTAIASRSYSLETPITKLIVPLGPDDGKLSIFLQNDTIDGAAGILHFFARFLRYDRNQAQFWQVNTPVLVR